MTRVHTRFRAVAVAAAVLALAASAAAKDARPPKAKAAGKTGKAAKPAWQGTPVRVDLYVMSKCPYGVQAEKLLIPILDRVGDAVDLHVGFVGDESEPGRFQSLHGDDEVRGDLLQACVAAVSPAALPRLLACMAEAFETIPANFEPCARKAGVAVAPVKACADGEQGRKLLSESFARADAEGVRGSPTLIVGGKKVQGARTTLQFLRTICGAFPLGARPEGCLGVPEPVAVDLLVLNDKRCETCSTDEAVEQLRAAFPDVVAKTVDYGTPEGKVLFEALKKKGIRTLPAFLFARATVDDTANAEMFEALKPYLQDGGDWRVLRTDSRFDPTAEICGNRIDDDGNGLTDCDDPACKSALPCRPAVKARLDLFVMSHCPFAVRAEGALGEFLGALGDAVDLRLHFIVDKEGGTYQSLHGPDEVAEDLRQACAAKHHAAGRAWLKYVTCRNADLAGDWKACAKDGIDAGALEMCATGDEGKALLDADAALVAELGVDASPTWLANNRVAFAAITPEAIRKGFCGANPGTKGCDKALSDTTDLPAGGGCGH